MNFRWRCWEDYVMAVLLLVILLAFAYMAWVMS
jgi:hypothetical protein